MLQQTFWIFEKELRYALRDTDVLIYSVLVPLIVYPILIISAGEILLWQVNSSQQTKVAIQKISEMPTYLRNALAKSPGVTIVEDKGDALKDLEKGKLDVVVQSTVSQNVFDFTFYTGSKRGYMSANTLSSTLTSAQAKAQKAAYEKFKVPSALLKVFDSKTVRFVPMNTKRGAIEKESPLVLVCAVIVGLMQAGLVAGVTGVCMFAEEKEKNTFETTVSLPVPSYVLTAGKWLAATALTVASSILYMISVGCSYVVIAMQMLSLNKLDMGALSKLVDADTYSCAVAILTILLGAGVGCAMCMLAVSGCKTFKDAQAICAYPMMFILLLPMLAVIPGIEQYPGVAFIPLTNTLLALKHPQSSMLQLVLGVLESISIIAFCLWLSGRIFFSEKSMFLITDGGAKNPQQQAESI